MLVKKVKVSLSKNETTPRSFVETFLCLIFWLGSTGKGWETCATVFIIPFFILEWSLHLKIGFKVFKINVGFF